MEWMVAELAGRGKLLVAEPYFDAGPPITVDRKSMGPARRGDLVVLRPGRGRARIERVLGPSGSIESVLEGLLWQRGIRRPHAPVPPEPRDPEPDRVDLRQLLAFTIDPEGAKDFDDAISARAEGDGVRVWVHIADVTRYLPAGSPLDHDAAARGVSVYVPGRVEPMLPEALSNDLCSLRPHVERHCVTVEIPFDANLDAGEPLFYRSVIISRERLTYGDAELILGGHERVSPELTQSLKLADRVSAELRRRRFARGALRIETGEISFAFDGEGGVERAWIESEPTAHALIEELMILANEAVARLLAGRKREALFRVHERPDPQSVELLVAKLEALEVPTPPVPEHLTPGEAGRLVGEISERVTEYMLQSGRGAEAFPALVLRSLKQARYHPENLGHSGLASTAYGHFTSPIRRYPDVVVHRALLAELGVGEFGIPAELDELAESTSLREREASQVEYAADELCLAWLLERRLFEDGPDSVYPGEIVGAIGSGLFVRFDGVFEGYVPARRIPDDYYELDPLGVAMVGRRNGHRYRLGDEIEVRVEGIRRHEGKVELAPA
jgi:ribonuclease R